MTGRFHKVGSGRTVRGVCAGYGSRPGRIEARLRADEPFFAAPGKGFASLPQREGLLERRRPLLELVHDPDELIPRPLVR